jgi:hypothetical protein
LKFGFDEHIGPTVVETVSKLLVAEGDMSTELVMARDLAERPQKSDVAWLTRFAKEGGRVVITGDRKMRANLHEQEALSDLGLIVFFFPSDWNNWKLNKRSAFLVLWWPEIVKKALASKPGDRWELKDAWVDVGEFRDVKARAKDAAK